MPKAAIHPLVQRITVVLRNGSSVQLNTILRQQRPRFLQLDPTNHVAWTGVDTNTLDVSGRAADYKDKFGDFGFDE